MKRKPENRALTTNNLARQKALVKSLLAQCRTGEVINSDVQELCELVLEMDRHLCNGELYPTSWEEGSW